VFSWSCFVVYPEFGLGLCHIGAEKIPAYTRGELGRSRLVLLVGVRQ
jgi:hypothetical protein